MLLSSNVFSKKNKKDKKIVIIPDTERVDLPIPS